MRTRGKLAVALVGLILVLAAFSWGFLAAQFKIFPYRTIHAAVRGVDAPAAQGHDPAQSALWASKVVEGGYILMFRHTQRERWDDVLAFDMLEVATGARAEDESYARAVCLTDRGREEARMIGAVFAEAGVTVSEVLTSPSCRARQTAAFAFGREGRIVDALNYSYRGAESEDAAIALRALLEGVEIVPGQNVVTTGHSGTLSKHPELLVDRNDLAGVPSWERRAEGGFTVLERDGSELVVRHVFRSFTEFATAVLRLPAP